MSKEEILRVAKDLAWKALDPGMQHAYLHNAETAIETEKVSIIEQAVEEAPAAVDQCLSCGGKGFTEYEHGLLRVECEKCGGTGKVKGIIKQAEALTKELEELVEETTTDDYLAKERERPELAETTVSPEEVIDDSISGTKRDNKSVGSKNPGKPKQPKKPKAKKTAGAKSS